MIGIRDWLEARRIRALSDQVTPEGARARVARGAEYLDEVDPMWYFRIDPETLDLNSPGCCVLGQLHGDYRAGLFRSDILNPKSTIRASLSPVSMGFQSVPHPDGSQVDRDYRYLTEAWRNEIAARLKHDTSEEMHLSGVRREDIVPA